MSNKPFAIQDGIKFPDGSIQTTAYTGNNPNVWVQTFVSDDGSPTDIVAIAVSVEYDSSGNVIALFSHNNNDTSGTYYSVGKYTTTGTKIWTARFADGFNTDGWGLAVAGNYIYVAGKTLTSDESGYDVSTLTKLDSSDGSIEWSKVYDFGYASSSNVVDVASDGNPVMVGYASNGTDNYVTTTKVDAADGDIIWSRALNGQNDEEAYGMAVGPDGEVVAIGWMENLGVVDTAATLYADPVSNVVWIWSQTGLVAGGVTFDVSFTDGVPTFSNIVDTTGGRTVGGTVATISGEVIGGTAEFDDMVVKVGSVTAGNSDNHMLVVKYASNGTITWQKAILFDAGFDCRGADADIDSNGNIYVTGSYQYVSGEFGTTSALSILKLDDSGIKQWSRRVEGTCDTFGVSVVVGADDKLYLSGVTAFAGYTGGEPDINNGFTWVAAKYGFDGTVEWQRLIDHTSSWSFTGDLFFNAGGGSNLAVKDGYVVLGGGFGNLAGSEDPRATVVQVADTGDVFSTGAWAFTAASFSGVLNSSASDITVSNALKTDTDNVSNISVATVTPEVDISAFLLGTLYIGGEASNQLVNGAQTLALNADGSVTLPTLTVPLEDNANPIGTGQVLKFSDSSQQAIIFGPVSTAEFLDAERIIIQGAPGYTGTSGEGGDVYLWAGPGGDADGNGGDIKVRAGYGPGTGTGGYLNFQAGDSSTGTGGYINIESGESNTYGSGGDITMQARSGGEITLRTYGPDSKDWTFGTNGGLTLPAGGVISEGGGISGAIKLTPAGGANEYQALLIYPTAAGDGDHIHLTAGGGTTELYLGNDFHYVKLVEPSGNIEVRATHPDADTAAWTFDTAGNIDTQQALGIKVPNGVPSSVTAITSSTASWELNPLSNLATTGGSGSGLTVTVTQADGYVNAIAIATAGTGYTAGDVITVTSGTSNATFNIAIAGRNTWLFGEDGTTTLPANSSILTNETALKIATHSTTTYTFNQAYWEALNGNATRMLTITGNAQYFSCTVTANQDGTYTVADLTGNSFEPGDWFKVPGNELGGVTPANDIQINIATVDGAGVILTTTITGTAVGKQWQFGTDGTTTLPGAVIKSTVAKTGVILPTTTGVVNGLTHDSVLTGLTDNTYGPFTLSGVTFSVFVFGGVINSAQSISSTGTATVNDVLGTIDSGVIGGTAGTTITWTVDTVVQETPTAIDLTKFVNKLTDGSYTLANGVEGQIMYIVRQNGSTAANIFVEVASARWDGSVYSDQPVIPFQIPFTDMVTIIFTDGAWQSSTFGSLT